jgi:hypothetical protein
MVTLRSAAWTASGGQRRAVALVRAQCVSAFAGAVAGFRARQRQKRMEPELAASGHLWPPFRAAPGRSTSRRPTFAQPARRRSISDRFPGLPRRPSGHCCRSPAWVAWRGCPRGKVSSASLQGARREAKNIGPWSATSPLISYVNAPANDPSNGAPSALPGIQNVSLRLRSWAAEAFTSTGYPGFAQAPPLPSRQGSLHPWPQRTFFSGHSTVPDASIKKGGLSAALRWHREDGRLRRLLLRSPFRPCHPCRHPASAAGPFPSARRRPTPPW